MKRLVLLLLLLAGPVQAEERRSGFADMSRETQVMQQDDTLNPAMLWVAEGEVLWNSGSPSCASCHGTPQTMRGVAARYPAYDAASDKVFDLARRVNACRSRHQGQAPFVPESDEMLALTALIGQQSRGLPLAPPDDARLAPHRQRGETLYRQRIGQLNFSCVQCHDDNAGRRLAGSIIPQGHPTGYPLYRLEWQGLGSLQRRLRNCMIGVRAEPFAYDADAMIELELYLVQRARGMPVETPAVRP